jgi:hypothetical protein
VFQLDSPQPLTQRFPGRRGFVQESLLAPHVDRRGQRLNRKGGTEIGGNADRLAQRDEGEARKATSDP